MTHQAVILARGLGTRMRRSEPAAQLDPQQATAADRGHKAMVSFGRPFLDYSLSALVQAGVERACLVIGPEHHDIRDYYTGPARPRRIHIDFAIQAEPRGTADAVLAAAAVVGNRPFLVLNGDNYYPADVLRRVADVSGWATAAFAPKGLLSGNIPAERLGAFALLDVDPEGFVRDIIEKPGTVAGPARPVSMNCWQFDPVVFDACRVTGPSPRGELELPDAVRYALGHLGQQIRAVPVSAAVLDLSVRSDIAAVARALATVEVAL